MGSFFSKSRYVSDPAEFATFSNAEAELTAVDECRAYDYIVVGAGFWPRTMHAPPQF
jgi:hypothetical protein